MNITEDYCSFEIAKLLKKKGFDEFSYYGWDEQLFDKEHPRNFSISIDDEKRWISCHTHQKAMKWLREVHHIIFVFKPSYFSGDECTYWTYERWCGDNFDGEVLSFKTYKEAVEAALKYVLENLI